MGVYLPTAPTRGLLGAFHDPPARTSWLTESGAAWARSAYWIIVTQACDSAEERAMAEEGGNMLLDGLASLVAQA